jgi:hypothetical protein
MHPGFRGGRVVSFGSTDQQPGHPQSGVSREQGSGRLTADSSLTVVGIGDRADGRGCADLGQSLGVPNGKVLGGFN